MEIKKEDSCIYSGWDTITDAEFKAIECNSAYVVNFGYSADTEDVNFKPLPTAVIQIKWREGEFFVHEVLYKEESINDLTLAKLLIDMGVTKEDLIIVDFNNCGWLRISVFRQEGEIYWDKIEGYPELSKGFSMEFTYGCSCDASKAIRKVQETKVYMTENFKKGWDEYQKYSWRIDIDGNLCDDPIGSNNRIMDCIKYFVQYTEEKKIND
jgi:hypothetical protein